jgi:hypothetical protein
LSNIFLWVYLLLVGKNASSDGGAVVATPADEHDSVVEDKRGKVGKKMKERKIEFSDQPRAK